MFRMPFLQRLIGTSVLTLLATLGSTAQAQPAVRPALPVRTSPADLQVTVVESVTIGARVIGQNATTRVDIVLRNPNAAVIESAVEFPLREGQTVTGFALESLDRSRFLSAAPVEKAKGQAVFEQIVREGSDPALLEKTVGNNFRLRVYPIAPRETRTVRLEIREFLSPGPNGRLLYKMPQMLKDARPQNFRFSLELDGITQPGVILSEGLKTALQSRLAGSTRLTFSPARNLGNVDYTVSWPTQGRVFTDYGSMDGETYFHAQVPLSMTSISRKPPNPITLIWDSSGSGRTRDHAREFAFLDATFKALGHVKVHLIETHVVAEQARDFEVTDGKWAALREALEKVQYDGASNPAAWSTTAPRTRNYTKEELAGFKGMTLVFSDGIGNWGTDELPSQQTLFTITSSAGANTAALRALAEPSGGQLIDLLETPVAQAATELLRVRARLVRMTGDGADQLVSLSTYAEGGVVQIAGHMARETASVTLEFVMPNGSIERRKLELNANPTQAAQARAAQSWATLWIAQLETNTRLHQAEILRIGSEFGVISSRTSLIILERLEDYLRFDVIPSDPQWREQFKQRAKDKAAREATAQSLHMIDLLKKFEERAAWWEKTFPKDDMKVEPTKQDRPMAVAAMAPPPAPAPAPIAAAPPPFSAPSLSAMNSRSAEAFDRMRAESSERRRTGQAPTVTSPALTPRVEVREMGIALQKQQLTSAYAVRLRDAAANERYAIYLDEKISNSRSSAFYLDASEIFFEKGQPELGERVLSNLAEIELEDRALLRILAYHLQQAKQYRKAIMLFERVITLAPNEPKSWRDLGLAYAASGEYQKAVNALWNTANRKWDNRFADIGLIALGELNAIAANAQGLDLSRVDPRLARNLPVDLRVVLGWDADNTDIDLWVKDPNGEDAYYERQLTYQGGRMSRDFTGGYGPEEYMVKLAKPGRYELRAKFFNSRQQRFSPYTTVMLRFVTGFGTPNQKEQSVIMRLPEKGTEVLVGSFEVNPSTPQATQSAP